jgi:hypothetical protein
MKLDQNIHPNLVSYNVMMDCWCNLAHCQAEAAPRALSILRHLQQQQDQQQQQQQQHPGRDKIRPNAISYTTCIIWAFAAAKKPQQAEKLFREMEEQASIRDDPSLQPNLYTYCALISAWGKTGRPTSAQAVFDALVSRSQTDESLRPNTAIYSALLSAWATAGDVVQSVSILQSMCDDYEEGKHNSAKPNERCFSAVINALSRSKHADAAPQAEACLVKMEEMAENGLVHVRPNVYTFQSVISAWASSDLPVAAEQAEANLQRLKELYHSHGDIQCRPNVIAYTNTLRAWLRASGGGYVSARRSEALLDEMLRSKIPQVQPIRITYGTVLRTIAESRLSDKYSRAQRIAQIMKDRGMELDPLAKEQLRKAHST